MESGFEFRAWESLELGLFFYLLFLLSRQVNKHHLIEVIKGPQTCNHCDKNHDSSRGRHRSGACLQCGSLDHVVRNCSNRQMPGPRALQQQFGRPPISLAPIRQACQQFCINNNLSSSNRLILSYNREDPNNSRGSNKSHQGPSKQGEFLPLPKQTLMQQET